MSSIYTSPDLLRVRDTVDMSILSRLEAAKARNGLTDAQAGAIFGVTQQTFHKWRTGKQLPDVSRIPELARWLEVDEVTLVMEWQETRLSGGLTEEQTASAAAQLRTAVAALNDVVDHLRDALARADRPPAPPQRPVKRSRQTDHR